MSHPVAAVLVVLTVLGPSCCQAAKTPRAVGSVDIPLDGTAVSLPPMSKKGEYLVRVSGSFRCDIDGRRYDAAYRASTSGEMDQPHDLLVIEPSLPALPQEDRQGHVYTYGPIIPDDAGHDTVLLRLNVDKLVNEFIRSPSEVRQSLSGDLRAELLFSPPAVSPWVLLAMVGLPILVVLVVIASLAEASAKAAKRPYEDIIATRRRIARKCKEARDELAGAGSLFQDLAGRVARLGEGCEELAEHVSAFREVRLNHDPRQIEAEIARMEREMQGESQPDIRDQYQAQIDARRQTLAYLRANSENEARYLLRLANAEATIDNLRLKLPHLRVQLSETGTDTAAVARVDEELGLLMEAVAQTRELSVGPELPDGV